MPRYYNLTITAPGGSQPFRQWTTNPQASGVGAPSSPNTQQTVYDPAALNVIFDLIIQAADQPSGYQNITVEGVPLSDLQQAIGWTGYQVELQAGMTAGPPLANPQQRGTILKGQIYQAFGNWVGTDMTLDLVISGTAFTLDSPGNFNFNRQPGQPLAEAIQSTLNTAMSGVTQNVSISSQLVVQRTEPGTYGSLTEFATMIRETTKGVLGSTYPGVTVALQSGQLYVFDGTTPAQNSMQFAFTDFVGQPTWINQNLMQVTTVLRGDLQIGGSVKMPQGLQDAPGIVTTTAASMPSSLKYQSAFQGAFTIQGIRHVGNLRAPDAREWVSIFNCFPTTPTS